MQQPQLSIDIEGNHNIRPFAPNEPPGEIRAGNPIRIPDWYPVFCEGYVLPRLKECIRLLISEEARLQLDIGAIVVRECVAPIKAIRVNTPGPNFLSR